MAEAPTPSRASRRSRQNGAMRRFAVGHFLQARGVRRWHDVVQYDGALNTPRSHQYGRTPVTSAWTYGTVVTEFRHSG
jgi:hypothetical protein